MPTDFAVSQGIRSTAGVVTSAAAIMIAVFAVFATLSTVEFKQMGVGLAVAVLIDATIIRGVLLPAAMKLLGDWNWYLPQRLHWLPRDGARAGGVRRAGARGREGVARRLAMASATSLSRSPRIQVLLDRIRGLVAEERAARAGRRARPCGTRVRLEIARLQEQLANVVRRELSAGA